MATYNIGQVRPMPGWAVCQSLKPISQSSSGLIMAKDMETGKTGECVAEVMRVTFAYDSKGQQVDPLFQAGDKILIRDFLKFANPIGDMVGADRDDRVFLLNNLDAVAVISGPGTLGAYDEFVLE